MTIRPKFALRPTAAIVAATIALGGLAGCGGGSDSVSVSESVPPVNPPLIGAEATSSSKAMSWFSKIAEALSGVAEGVEEIATGNVVAGVAEFASAGLGLIGKGLETDKVDVQATKLNEINTKLDTLNVTMQSIELQGQSIENQIKDLAATDLNIAAMNTPMVNAQKWLLAFYTNPNSEFSREWVRWETSGCLPTEKDNCLPVNHPVTPENLKKFRDSHMKNLENATPGRDDNFPLYWAYGVVGYQTGMQNFERGGTASALVDSIYFGLTNHKGTAANGLVSYMNHLMATSDCATDVSNPKCDLYGQVYQKLETYFQLAISRQAQLVMALSEAETVLMKNKHDGNKSAGQNLMAGYNKQLNEEVEVFLQVAEQIALYRAADGATDWNNFGDLDAGKLLARADFVVAQLAGKNYVVNNKISADTTTGTLRYTSSPWPSSGVVGRIFYADQEPVHEHVLPVSCVEPCTDSLTSLTENDFSRRLVSDAKPYLTWSAPALNDDKTKAPATATARTQWTVRRLTPQILPALPSGSSQYNVTSARDGRVDRVAKLTVNSYDSNFEIPKPPDSQSLVKSEAPGSQSLVKFGSFSSVAGNIGRYGLSVDQWATTFAGSTDLFQLSDFSKDSPTSPGGMSVMSVDFLRNPKFGSSAFEWYSGSTKTTWTAKTNVVLINTKDKYKVNVKWPSVIDINLDSKHIATTYGTKDECKPFTYYDYVHVKQSLEDNTTKKIVDIGSAVNSQCNGGAFKSCSTNGKLPLSVTASTSATDMTFNASFTSSVTPYRKCGDINWNTVLSSNWVSSADSKLVNSYVNWNLQPPTLVLSK